MQKIAIAADNRFVTFASHSWRVELTLLYHARPECEREGRPVRANTAKTATIPTRLGPGLLISAMRAALMFEHSVHAAVCR